MKQVPHNNFESKLNDFLDQKYQHIEIFRPGLERPRVIFDPLIQLIKDTKLKIITIAGTNGKGEVSHLVSSYLSQAGKSSSLWTSPHVSSVTERFKYNLNKVDPEILFQIFEDVDKEVDLKVLSYYEFLFYCFLKYSLMQDYLDYIILEVGLGGRLDAVNLLDADISAICSISRDHCAILGNKLSEILTEKYGVARGNRPLITCLEQQFLRDILKRYSKRDLVIHKDLFEENIVNSTDDYTQRNILLAKNIVESLISAGPENLSSELKLNARREVKVINEKMILYNGCHNIDGVKKFYYYLLNNIDQYKINKFKKIYISFSSRDFDELVGICDIILEYKCLFDQIILCEFIHPKAIRKIDLQKVYNYLLGALQEGRIEYLEDINTLRPDDLAESNLVIGSYYFIGEYKKRII